MQLILWFRIAQQHQHVDPLYMEPVVQLSAPGAQSPEQLILVAILSSGLS